MDNTVEDFYDFDSEQEYAKQVTISPVTGGWIIRYTDLNPRFELYTGKDGQQYDHKIHTKQVSRSRIFTEQAKLTEWLNTRL